MEPRATWRPTISRSPSTRPSPCSGPCSSRASPAPARRCWRWRWRRRSAPLIEWHIKSTTKAQQGLYEYDAVSRLRDSQLGDERVARHPQLHQRGKLWEAFTMDERPVLLIDEIDKADIEFPNDLLQELDRMEFYVYETRRDDQGDAPARSSSSPPTTRRSCPTPSCAAASSTTSSSPTTRRCARSSTCTSPTSRAASSPRRMKIFYEIREVPGLKKKPSTSELLDWLKLLAQRGHLARNAARERPAQADPAAARRAAQERAGRAPVRAPRLHRQAPGRAVAGTPGEQPHQRISLSASATEMPSLSRPSSR